MREAGLPHYRATDPLHMAPECAMPTLHTAAFIDALRAAFAAHADASRAGEMQAYMKSALPFHGIPAPLRRTLCAGVVKAHPAPDALALAAAMQWLVIRFGKLHGIGWFRPIHLGSPA